MSGATQSIRLVPDVLRSIDTSTFTGSYQAIGTPLAVTCRIIKFTNNSNTTATLSWDGVHDNEILPPNSFVLLDSSTNRELSRILEVAIGTQFYAKGAAGVGSLYISVYTAA